MSRRLVAGLVALIAIGGVFAFGLSKQDDVSSQDTENVTVPPEGFQTFAAAAITGHGVRRRGTSRSPGCRASPSFINFWGSWCEPCKREAPELRVVQRRARRPGGVRRRRDGLAARRRRRVRAQGGLALSRS